MPRGYSSSSTASRAPASLGQADGICSVYFLPVALWWCRLLHSAFLSVSSSRRWERWSGQNLSERRAARSSWWTGDSTGKAGTSQARTKANNWRSRFTRTCTTLFMCKKTSRYNFWTGIYSLYIRAVNSSFGARNTKYNEGLPSAFIRHRQYFEYVLLFTGLLYGSQYWYHTKLGHHTCKVQSAEPPVYQVRYEVPV